MYDIRRCSIRKLNKNTFQFCYVTGIIAKNCIENDGKCSPEVINLGKDGVVKRF